ncbi:copper chaperone PCu(A)C [Shimia abyssi]|uniref:Copper(I)-binding protein n=1 Tax=Shimia abyssi TaxID=1662395 RepID=A0A2P8F654_9RHOB|nr:copper chaperone PCu(A)C [Shimia abyssi]PSL17197.1 copper(I)-binding protein [Shimia abyssi]
MTGRNLLKIALLVVVLLACGFWLFQPRQTHGILLSNATAAALSEAPNSAAVFVKIENTAAPDRLLQASTPDADNASLSEQIHGLAIPSSSAPSLAPDGVFLRLTGLRGPLEDGRALPITLVFENAGEVTTRARIIAPKSSGEASKFGLFGIGDICRVGEGEPAPHISVAVIPNGDGWYISIQSDQFEFTPNLVDGPHVPGTGHGHLYLNGLKMQRLYQSTAQIGALPQGEHEVRVTLNTNDHRAYVVGDDPVTASVRFVVE